MRLDELEAFYLRPPEDAAADPLFALAHESLLLRLETGELRAAGKGGGGLWSAVPWVKSAILAGFRGSPIIPFTDWPGGARDKAAFPPRDIKAGDGVRFVPGGSSVRRGAHLAPGVIVMPPSFINVGAWIGEGTMGDSHVLVGSCAQVGERVHLSAGVQIGGVLEPAGARPVIVEDEAFVGGLVGLFEGVVVGKRAVLAPGLVIGASTPIFDLVHGRETRGEVPANAVVVPGSRPAGGAYARGLGLSLHAACIVKYRDARTDAATALEEALR